MGSRRQSPETWSPASVARMAVGAIALAAVAAAIIWTMVDRWGEPLLDTVGSRNTPLWLSWIILSVLLVISVAFLWICVTYLIRVLRGRIPRQWQGREHDHLS
ncbi:hypothetical protein [Agreia sp. Leaf283]|uniref:hypothetical protein n=1 Tax=Agreia sp. Leaf283 TaxID=1736321 RepID=UPI0006FC44FA|nr:hypothetical protein [Agreia sp. Leaf283]KQP53897.1 hypothetical protein ASF51_17345 [Agreia sp. Leaf283]